MSVFKEAFEAIRLIQNSSSQVYIDACDFGAPACKGDRIWEAVQTIHKYKMPEEKEVKRHGSGFFEVELINEQAVSNGEMTVQDATKGFQIHYTSLKGSNRYAMHNMFKGADGFIEIYERPTKAQWEIEKFYKNID